MTPRERFQEYIQNIGLDTTFKHSCTVTRDTEDLLRYARIDRYDALFIDSTKLKSLVDWIHTQSHIEIYFAFGKVCIGYLDREYGNTMRLSAFVQDIPAAGSQDLDKEFVQVPGLDLASQEDKGVFQ